MTSYTETIGKNTEWRGRNQMQTGLLPAIGAGIPSISSIAGTIAGIGGSLGLGAIGSKILSSLSRVGSTASRAGSAAGGGTATGLAKLGLGTAAITQINRFMNSGPEIGGVNIIPAAAIGGGILLAGKIFLG